MEKQLVYDSPDTEDLTPSAPPETIGALCHATGDDRTEILASRIAIIDDEPINIKVARKYLEHAGFTRFCETTKSRQAISLIQEERPDLILLDIMMPEVDGLDILKELASDEMLARIPVLVLTATSDPEIKKQALNLGAVDFLQKPIDTNDLVPRTQNALLLKKHCDQLLRNTEIQQQKVRDRTEELVINRLELIHCLARAAEYRDDDTGRHVLRVGRYVGIIARELGLDDESIELLEHASPLHDIGKIGVPDSILLKPGKLTPEEWDMMQTHANLGKSVFECITRDEWDVTRTHTEIGHKIIGESRSPILVMAGSIALTHHEWWDGTGYPLALAGEDIPIEGRITAVADVFDALTTKRPYKPAYPLAKCLGILEEGRGTHFDPRVLDAFFARKDEIVAIQIEYSDSR